LQWHTLSWCIFSHPDKQCGQIVRVLTSG
jgi:hypothetical protein